MSIPLGPGVHLLQAHPCGLCAFEKPPGVRSHPNARAADPRALLVLPYDAGAECYRDGDRAWHLLHRLDAPTSGVMLLTEDADLAARIRERFANRGVEKTYLALVRGKPTRAHELWKDHLRTAKEAGAVRSARGGGALALAQMDLRRFSGGRSLCSLLELRPKTGRTHQLRLQCAARRLPIVGDATYGDFRFNREFAQANGFKRLFLHAWKIEVPFEWGGRTVRFAAEAPIPPEFEAAVR